MTTLNKKNIKLIPVGASIHIIGKDLDIEGTVTKCDEEGIRIFSKRNTIIGLPASNVGKYSYEIL